ncbi:MAG: FAD-dependent oxidoreductase, partial [Hyphomicrobiaceae bacterium]|nr:FAD-dependent oxidoreductase [Hyphomicrobiaceae bacterium]
DALEFLRNVNLGDRTPPGNQVVVIGGGNVAIDAARAGKRSGTRKMTVVYRRSKDEMPAYAEEVSGAIEEGIEFSYLTAPVRVRVNNGKVVGLECVRTELGAPDESGRRRPVVLQGSEFLISCDAVISAIGQRVDTSWADQIPDLKWSRRGTLEVNPDTMQTSLPHVFAAGDAVSGPASIIEAIAAGHGAVKAIDHYLTNAEMGEALVQMAAANPGNPDWQEIPENVPEEARALPEQLEAASRWTSFEEIEQGLLETEARQEAHRCLNCGICSECKECVRVCEPKAIDHSMKEEEMTLKVGSIILATGYDTMDPTPLKQYGYGVYPNVFTALEFERLSNATGPTGGKILIRDENGEFTRTPKKVAIL